MFTDPLRWKINQVWDPAGFGNVDIENEVVDILWNREADNKGKFGPIFDSNFDKIFCVFYFRSLWLGDSSSGLLLYGFARRRKITKDARRAF